MYKTALKKYFLVISTLLIIFPIGIYGRDPYMLFHEKWFNKNKIYDNLRIQNYGLIKYSNFDSMILGTSMLENTSSDEASKKLNSNFVNLSMSGSSFYERYKVLSMALKTKELKHVIFSLDYRFSEEKVSGNTFYPDLYNDNNVSSKLKIYITTKALGCIFFNYKCDMIDYNLDRPAAWYYKEDLLRRFNGFHNWVKFYHEDDQVKDAFKELLDTKEDYTLAYKEYKQVIDNEIMPLLKHSATSYSIIVPPYSLLWWNKRKKHLDKFFEPYAYLIEKTANMPNVKIYWFYDDNTAGDINQYKDLSHYHHRHNSKQIDAIKNGTNVINQNNYIEKLNNFKKRIYKFDIEKYIQMVPQEYKNN